MNKISSEVNSIINKLRELKVSYIDLSKDQIKINNVMHKLNNSHQMGGFINESSSDIFSDTSIINQNGGNLFSETSAMNNNDNNNKVFSETSAMNENENENENKNKVLSETSAMSENGNNNLFLKNDKINNMYSETSELNKKYSELDTLHSITELENSELDLDIFKKSLNQQKGGSLIFNKKKLNDIGIKSSSTSSVCE